MAQGSPFDTFFGGGFPHGPSSQETPEKGVAWQAKEVNGKLYLPIEQVHELLSSNGVLSKMTAALKRHMGGG